MKNQTEFHSLELTQETLQNIMFLGFKEMTPIQSMAVFPALEGRDVIGQAKTGTGKTLAFAVPVIEKVDAQSGDVQALVLTPTRELAIQVSREFEKLAGSKVKLALIYGGASMKAQIKQLKAGSQVVVGTPGRVIDHIRRGGIDLSNVETLVLDEADRMLDMGFIKDVEWIIRQTPRERQTMLFSATMPDGVKKLGERYMRDPQFISANKDEDELTVGDIAQFYVEVNQKEKMDAFFDVLKQEEPDKALVFCKTKKWTETLYGILKRRRFNVERIHGDMSQAAREKVMSKFREGNVKYLVCTDVVARGLDVDDVSHVFNYDLPQEPLTYVHRIGRTGRAGKTGVAVSLVNPQQIRDLWLIEHEARTSIEEKGVDDFGS